MVPDFTGWVPPSQPYTVLQTAMGIVTTVSAKVPSAQTIMLLFVAACRASSLTGEAAMLPRRVVKIARAEKYMVEAVRQLVNVKKKRFFDR